MKILATNQLKPIKNEGFGPDVRFLCVDIFGIEFPYQHKNCRLSEKTPFQGKSGCFSCQYFQKCINLQEIIRKGIWTHRPVVLLVCFYLCGFRFFSGHRDWPGRTGLKGWYIFHWISIFFFYFWFILQGWQQTDRLPIKKNDKFRIK